MATTLTSKPGGTFRITIKKAVTNLDAYRTLERLFMRDKDFARPIKERSSNFVSIPKRRGGRIWTKYPNKIQPTFKPGMSAVVPATTQYARDLASVQTFVDVTTA